jgi:hypothetical protein
MKQSNCREKQENDDFATLMQKVQLQLISSDITGKN